MNIQIKAWFGDWTDATRAQARRFWLTWSRGAHGYDVPAIAERFGVRKMAMYTNLRRWRKS